MDINKVSLAIWTASEIVQALAACSRDNEYYDMWLSRACEYFTSLNSLLIDLHSYDQHH